MNLVIDIGNTRTKFAFFEAGELIKTGIYQGAPDYRGIKKTIISSVAEDPNEYIENKSSEYFKKFSESGSCILFTNDTRLPVINNYKTPESLGSDRLASVVAAHRLFPQNNVLVIDAGTCITFDFIDSKGVYHGGSISPGLDMRLKALNTFTLKLPLVNLPEKLPKLTGVSTIDSMLSGVINGAIKETQGIMQEYKNKYRDIKIIFTGGDYLFFEKALKKSIFADPYLVLRGLDIILEYNTS